MKYRLGSALPNRPRLSAFRRLREKAQPIVVEGAAQLASTLGDVINQYAEVTGDPT